MALKLWPFLLEETMDYFSLFVGFLLGIATLQVLYFTWDLGTIGLYVKEAEKGALIMLASTAESIAYIQAIKYQTMKDLEIPENLLKTTKNVDDYNFNSWKNSAVSNLLAAYPERFKSLPQYVDWNTAMKVLDQIYKNGQKGV
tara:strand:- start:103 stop:531 length:429 start_codon:yes stop_codon:yes gene_type:complete